METQRNQVTGVRENIGNGANQKDENYKIQQTGLNEALSENSIIRVTGEMRNGSQRKSYRSKPWLESLVAFANDVSVVGLRYVANTSASAFRRSIWVLLILLGAGFTAFQIENRIRYFAGYPVNVVVSVEYMEEMRFPTVTICNENHIQLSKVSAMGKQRL